MIPQSPFLSLEEKALSWLSTTAGGALVKPPGQGKVVSPLVRPSPFLKEILNAGAKSLPNSHTKSAPLCAEAGEGTPCRGPTGRCMIRQRYNGRLRVVPHPAEKCGEVEEGKPDYKPPPRAKKEKPQVQREVKVKPTVEQVEQGIAQFMKEGSDTPEARATLLSAIASLTVKQIHDLKRRSAGVLKASGNKETLVNKLVDRIVAKVKPVTQETGPKTETQKVVEEVNKPEPSAADRVKDALGRMLQQANLDPEGDAFDAALTAYTRILEDVTLNPDDPERASDGLREFQEVLSEVRKNSRQQEMEQEDRERKIQQEEEDRKREEDDRQRAEQEEAKKDITPESQPEAFLDAQGGPKQETDEGPQVSKEGNPEEQYFGEESTPERWKEHPSIKALGDKFKLGKADDPKVRESVEQLARVPARLIKMMVSHLGLEGVSVGEGAFTDFEAGRPFKGVRPRGWSEGKTWDDVPGAYDSTKKHVVIGTRGNHGSESLALHEFGHAVGHLMGWDTNDEWSQIHKEVFNDLSPYFQQEGEAGPQEMLAETFAATLMDRNEAVRNFGERAVKWMEAKIRDYQDPVGKEPHKEDQLQEASSSTDAEDQSQQSSAKTESGYGQSGQPQQPQQPQQSQSKVPGGLQLPDVGKSPFEKPQNNPTREQAPKAQSRPKTPRTGSRELDAKLSRERDPARAAVALIQNVREAFEASSVRRDVKPEELMGHYLDRLTDDQARQALISISGPAGRIVARQSNPKERLRRQFQTKWEILSRAEGISGRKG